MAQTPPSLPNYSPVGYFHPSLNMSPQRAAKSLVGVARSHSKAVKGSTRKVSGRGIVKSAGALFHQGGKK